MHAGESAVLVPKTPKFQQQQRVKMQCLGPEQLIWIRGLQVYNPLQGSPYLNNIALVSRETLREEPSQSC